MISKVNCVNGLMILLLNLILLCTVYGQVPPECQELEILAKQMNLSQPQSPINRNCVKNGHCTGINCNAEFKEVNNPLIPKTWLQPFCYAFEIMSCKSPKEVLVRLIDNSVHTTNYTYYFNRSELRPVESFSTTILKSALKIQMKLNVTFNYDDRNMQASFGMRSAVSVETTKYIHLTQYPEWGKVELVPFSVFTVARCTPETNHTISFNPCNLIPKLPDVQPTANTPLIVANYCDVHSMNACGKYQMCVPKNSTAGVCICALDAVYDAVNKSCKLRTPPTPHTLNPSALTTVIHPTVQTKAAANSKLGLYIGLGVMVGFLCLAAGSVGLFFVRRRARYRGHTRVLMVDDGLDTALLSDEDDMPISL